MSWRSIIVMCIIVALASLALYLSRREPERVNLRDPDVEELAGVVKAYKTVKAQASPPVTPEQACRGAIQGMLEEVDPFCRYIAPDKVDLLNDCLGGVRQETGLRVGKVGASLAVVGVLPRSPAAAAGIAAGSEILAIDDVPAEELTLEEARAMLACASDESVKLRLLPCGGEDLSPKPKDIVLPRGRFDVESVVGLARTDEGRWNCCLNPRWGIYYIHIREFLVQTNEDFHNLYRSLPSPRGLVLDLRGNPGGLLDAATAVADRFLSDGLIVRVVGRDGATEFHYAHGADTYPPVAMADGATRPMLLVVLVDGQTASGAEIVAGALQAHGRALLVGQRTRGKWCVMRTFDLGQNWGKIYLATAEYFLPAPAVTTQPATASAPAGTTQRGSALPVCATASRPSTRPLATAPGRTRRLGIMPDLTVAAAHDKTESLEDLWTEAEVLTHPQPSTGPTSRPGDRVIRLRRELLAADAQLAAAVTQIILRLPRAPTTAPATAPAAEAVAP